MENIDSEKFTDNISEAGFDDTVTVFGDPDNDDPVPSPEVLYQQYDIKSGDDFRDYGKLRLIGMGGMGMM